MQSAASPTHENLKGTARLEAFSDGVFAIAITLLALNLQVPHVESNSAKWALAFAASFVSIYLAMGICTALWIFWSVTIKDL